MKSAAVGFAAIQFDFRTSAVGRERYDRTGRFGAADGHEPTVASDSFQADRCHAKVGGLSTWGVPNAK